MNMLRTDDIPGAQPKRFTHAEKGHVKQVEPSLKLKTQAIDPRPNAKGPESPFALYGSFDPTSTAQKNDEPKSTKIVRRNVSQQIQSLLAPELHQKPVRANHRYDDVQGLPAQEPQENGNIVGYKLLPLRSSSTMSRSSMHQGEQSNKGNNYDSLDVLVSEKLNQATPGGNNTPLKKALHNFYGVTPPHSRNASYYQSLEIKRGPGNTNNNFHGMTDSYYQNKATELQEKALQHSGFNRAYKNFFGVSLSDSESFKANHNQFNNASRTPGGLQQTFTQANSQSLQQQLEQNIQQQRPHPLQAQSNLSKSVENLNFYLDPISHDKVFILPNAHKRGNLAKF